MLKSRLPIPAYKSQFESSPEYKLLNGEQQYACSQIFSGRNIALLGGAGVGKSFCIKIVSNFLEKQGVFVGKTGSTGVAALNISGSTAHAFCGVGIAEEDVQYLIKKAYANKKSRARIQFVKMLIIDEISMLGSIFLDKIDKVFRAIRNVDKPFGGCLVVFVGDCSQLLPIFKEANDSFFFNSNVWREGDFKAIELKKLMRQLDDPKYADLLNQIRNGEPYDESLLTNRIGLEIPKDKRPIRIFCKNVDVESHNNKELAKLNTEARTYKCHDTGDQKFKDFLDRTCQAPATLNLKIGARVCLLKNIDVDNGLVNGSLGTVERFGTSEPIVKFDCGVVTPVSLEEWSLREQETRADGTFKYRTVASRTQIPLKVAYGVTVHKAQSATFDSAEIDIAEAFAEGMVYTALSRLRSLDGLYLKSFNPAKVMVNEECREFYRKINESR